MKEHIGSLAKGCQYCLKGEKLVLFITGICPRNCVYCPLSKEKKNNDVIHANELKTKNLKKILEETRLSGAKGAGITGGDPLAKINRTIKFIKALKKEFGKKFHIHLYTSLELLDNKKVKSLKKSGLDELRIHPDLYNSKNWNKINLVSKKFKEVGIEIPIIPHSEKRVIELINYFKDKVDFFNLNQLEYATLYENEYKKRSWKISPDYSVKGSEKTALNILNYFKKSKEKIRIHYCSSHFKDAVQFTQRIKLRAKQVAKKFDKINSEGLLIRGAIYPNNPSISSLKKIQKQISKFTKYSEIDKKKSRIIFNYKDAIKISKLFPKTAIVEEYPTIDQLETEVNWLS